MKKPTRAQQTSMFGLSILPDGRHHYGTVPVARSADPETSHEAAASVRNATHMQGVIYALLCLGALTDEQIFARLTEGGHVVSVSGARTRRAELVEQKRVEWSGEWSTTASGRRTRIWKIAATNGALRSG